MSEPIASVEQRAGHEATHAHAVRDMFQRIAPTYDLLNRVLSAGFDQRWRRLAVDALAAPGLPPGELLDLCAGTLDLTEALERRLPERPIRAIDFAADMLARGRHKVRRATVEVGDAMALSAGDGAFAGCVCGFGLRNLADPRKGLAEVRRVLCRGGRLVVLEFFRPATGVLGAATRSFHAVYARGVLPLAGKVVADDREAYAYLARSMASFLTLAEAEGVLRELGFTHVRGVPLAPLGVASLLIGELPGGGSAA